MSHNGYKDPAKETLENGRSVADVMRSSGLRGLKGVIVSPAGVDGRPVDFDPHDKRNIQINIEPDTANSHSLTMADFTKDAISAAVASAKQKITGNDINAIRERSAMVFEELAAMANSGVTSKTAGNTARTTPPPVPAKTVFVPPAPAAPPVGAIPSPLTAFNAKKPAAIPAVSAAQASRPDLLPTKRVYFEKEGIGTLPALFHDVVVDVEYDLNGSVAFGFIVLIYDLRFEQADARWFPPADDPYKRPWAVQISDDQRIYLVHTTGFQYAYDNREFCVLLVEKAVEIAEGT